MGGNEWAEWAGGRWGERRHCGATDLSDFCGGKVPFEGGGWQLNLDGSEAYFVHEHHGGQRLLSMAKGDLVADCTVQPNT